MRALRVAVALFPIGAAVRPAVPGPRLTYEVSIDSTRHDIVRVRLGVVGLPESVRLAMKVHPEYDARFWRFVDSMNVRETSDDRAGGVRRVDSTLWQARIPGGRGTIEYVLHLPPEPQGLRDAWRCVVRGDGALLNPPDVLLYLPDFQSVPAKIVLHIPRSWSVATSLAQDHDGVTLQAPNAGAMLDAPILLGHLRQWRFRLANADYYVDYWPLPAAAPFDTARFVDGLRGIARETLRLFGGLPAGSYHFLIQDGAGDALEHRASVTIGVPSVELARNPHARSLEIAHEFFHSWNLVAIHPDHFGELSYTRTPPTSGLWWGEGVTLHYADVLVRRAGLADSASGTRADHLVDLATRYLGAAWFGRVSPEAASLAFGQTMLTTPNATGSYYLQGELLGEVLDAAIRDSTRDRRTFDDVMRALYARSAAGRGFTSSELVATFDSLCSCRLDDFFAATVHGAAPIDLTPVVRRLGWRLDVDTAPAADDRGTLLPDVRLIGVAVDSGLALVVNPGTQWSEAGLVTGDLLLDMNGSRPRRFSELYRALHVLHVGDSLTITVQRGGMRRSVAMVLRGYERPRVGLVDLDSVTTIQRERRARWLAGW